MLSLSNPQKGKCVLLHESKRSLTRLADLWSRARAFARSRQELLLLLALFTSTRLSLLVVSRPQGYLLDMSDYDFYLEFGRLADEGLYPMLHYWTEYPPVIPWLAVAAYKLIAALPTLNGSPIFWFRLAMGTLLLAFDVGNLLLMYGLGRRLHGPSQGLRTAWSYALLFAPLHVWLAWSDTVPLFFLLLSLYWLTTGSLGRAAIVAGLGFMVKIFPLLTLPALLKAERDNRRRLGLMTLSVLASLVVATPFLWSAPQFLLASFRSMVSRSPWETPWAIMEGYYGYGQVAPIQDRTDPTTATFLAYPTHLPWPAITVVFALLYLLLWTRRFDARHGRMAVAFTGLTVNLFLLYSKGYSPQFLIYAVPFALLLLPPLRAVAYLATLTAINLLEYPAYIVLFEGQRWILANLVFMRAAILLLISWEYATILGLMPSMERARQAAAVVAVVAFALWAANALPSAGQEWTRTSLDKHPDAQTIDYLRANAGEEAVVVFSDQWLYREMYPFLHEYTTLVLLSPPLDPRTASSGGGLDATATKVARPTPQVDQLSGRYREVFGVWHVEDIHGRKLEQLLASQGQLTVAKRVGDLTVSRWTTAP